MMTLPSASEVARHLRIVRSARPLVHCITNTVVQNVTANALLAVGASPAMVDIVGEAGPFARVASGLLVNLGTPSPEQRSAALEATAAAADAGTPWVLDPVAIGALPVRTPLAHRLAVAGPSVIRGNASEIAVLAGLGGGGRGTDADLSVDEAVPAAAALAERTGAVVAVSGAVDAIVDAGGAITRVPTGTPLLTRITGGGCALGAIVAAFLGACRDDDPASVTASAVAAYTIAAQRAAATAAGPGTFAVALLDELAVLDHDAIEHALASAAVAGATR